MKDIIRHILIFLILLAVAVLFGYVVGYNAKDKELSPGTDTSTHVNVIQRDSVVYNFIPKDSTIIDWHLKPDEHFDTITLHDTAYIMIPISAYHFGNGLADVGCKGYDVTLDSLCVHLTETMITETVTVKEPTYRNLVGAEVGYLDASVLYIRSAGRMSFGFPAGYTYDRQATARGIIGWRF